MREQLREQLNTFIYNSTNTTAYYYADAAGAIAQPSAINDVNPTYLTNNQPNAAYYTELATTITYGIAAASASTGSPQPLISPRAAPAVF